MYRFDIIKIMENDYIYPAINMMAICDFDGAQSLYIEMIEMLKIRYGYAPIKSNYKVKEKRL